jgi:hypothetical protein
MVGTCRSALIGLCALFGMVVATMAQQATVTLLEPNGGQVYHVGDTVTVRWTADTTVPQVNIQITLDGGDHWVSLFRSPVSPGGPGWSSTIGDTSWVVPDSLVIPPLGTVSVFSTQCLMLVYNYLDRSANAQSTTTFTIAAPSAPKTDDSSDCGCGSGAGAALIPPLFFKLRRHIRKRRK